jgi:hypothetical protein
MPFTPWGPLFPLTLPVLGDFAWINQETATVEQTYGGIHLYAPAQAGDDLRLLKKAAPATPYTITACFLPFLPMYNYAQCGLCWRQSSDGKLVTFGFLYGAGWELGVSKFSSPTVWVASYGTVLAPDIGHYFWLQISDDATNRICRYSLDGQHFYQRHTVARADYLTADEVGFVVNSMQATYEMAATLVSWKET